MLHGSVLGELGIFAGILLPSFSRFYYFVCLLSVLRCELIIVEAFVVSMETSLANACISAINSGQKL